MADQSQKTEKPTQKRLEKARKEGQYATSRDFVGALQFLVAVVVLVTWAPDWFHDLQRTLRLEFLNAFKRDFNLQSLMDIGWVGARYALFPIFQAGAILVLVALAIQLGVTRFGFSFNRLTPKWSRINPFGKLKDLPKQNLYATLQTVVTFGFCGVALWIIAERHALELFLLPLQPLSSGLALVYDSVRRLLWNVVGLFIVLGYVDLFRQLRKYDREMKMSRQEIRDKYKESEGNPA